MEAALVQRGVLYCNTVLLYCGSYSCAVPYRSRPTTVMIANYFSRARLPGGRERAHEIYKKMNAARASDGYRPALFSTTTVVCNELHRTGSRESPSSMGQQQL